MRIIVADCSAEYSGRLNASLPQAKRVLLIKADNSVLIFSELGSYKPLNWMAAPCTIRQIDPHDTYGNDSSFGENQSAEVDQLIKADQTNETDRSKDRQSKTGLSGCSDSSDNRTKTGQLSKADQSQTLQSKADQVESDDEFSDSQTENIDNNVVFSEEALLTYPEMILRVSADKSSDILEIALYHVYSDETYDLGEDPGLVKDGVEDHLQKCLAEQIERIGKGAKLIRREYPTAIGPVDIMALDAQGNHVAIEIKRHGGIDGVEQLTRYCELLNRDPLLAPVRGIFAAQTITPQARVLAQDRGFECLILDYDEMRGADSDEIRLF